MSERAAMSEVAQFVASDYSTARLAAAKRRGHKGGRPPALDPERVEQIVSALEGRFSKATVCRSFKVPRSTLLDTLA